MFFSSKNDIHRINLNDLTTFAISSLVFLSPPRFISLTEEGEKTFGDLPNMGVSVIVFGMTPRYY